MRESPTFTRRFILSQTGALAGTTILAGCREAENSRLDFEIRRLDQAGRTIYWITSGGMNRYRIDTRTFELQTALEEQPDAVRASPDGRFFAGLREFDSSGWLLGYTSGGRKIAHARISEGAFGLAVSPMGHTFLLRRSDQILHVDNAGREIWAKPIEVDGPREQAQRSVVDDRGVHHKRDLDRDLFFSQSLSWSPSGTEFAWSDRKEVHRCAVSSQRDLASWHGRSPTWSPDGSVIAYLRGEEAFLRRTSDGVEVPIMPSLRIPFALEWSPCSRFLLGRSRVPGKYWHWEGLTEGRDYYPLILIDRESGVSSEVSNPTLNAPAFLWLIRDGS